MDAAEQIFNECLAAKLISKLSSKRSPKEWAKTLGVDPDSPHRLKYDAGRHAAVFRNFFAMMELLAHRPEAKDALVMLLCLDYGEIIYDALTRLTYRQGCGWEIGPP